MIKTKHACLSALLLAVVTVITFAWSSLLVGQQTSLLYAAQQAQVPIEDPIPERIEFDGTTVRFENIVTLPQTTSGTLSPRGNPRTRLNFLYHARDGSGRIFANDLRGQLYVIYPEEKSWSTYLNIEPYFEEWFEDEGLNSGFSTFAFHPEFATNGLLYTIHTESPNGTPDYATFAEREDPVHGVLVEWQTEDPTADIFVGNQKREMLRIEQSDVIHGMQLVQFNPLARPGDADYGILYVSNGDGESSIYSDAAQNLGSLQGTIFRIDPAGNNSPNGKYGIPADNPFVNSSNESILKEIYAYGFRNPHRFTWDPETGLMLAGTIGQNNIEEVNIILPGANYGWNEREGTFVFDSDNPNVLKTLPGNDSDFNYTYPVAQYDHDEGFAIVGGFVYRGSLMPSMVGKFLFGDIVQGHLFTVNVDELVIGSQATIRKFMLEDADGNEIGFRELVDPENQRADLRFGLDEEGEIYIMSKQDGVVRRLISAEVPNEPTSSPTSIPTLTPTSAPTLAPTSIPAVTLSVTPTDTLTETPIPTVQATPTFDETDSPTTAVPSEGPSATSAPIDATITPAMTPTMTPSVALTDPNPTSATTAIATVVESPTDQLETPVPTRNPTGASNPFIIHFPVVAN